MRGSPNAAATERRTGAGAGTTLYVLGGDGRPVAIPVRAGITDGTSTAVYAEPLQEGDAVVVGASASMGSASSNQGVVNPFAPRMPGGRGRP